MRNSAFDLQPVLDVGQHAFNGRRVVFDKLQTFGAKLDGLHLRIDGIVRRAGTAAALGRLHEFANGGGRLVHAGSPFNSARVRRSTSRSSSSVNSMSRTAPAAAAWAAPCLISPVSGS